MEVSYVDYMGSRPLDDTIVSIALKYLGAASQRDSTKDRRILEFLFPHFEQASLFTAELHLNYPQVAVERIA